MTKHKHPKLNNPIEKHFDIISRYHYFMFTILFTSLLPIFWHILSLIFLTPPMDFYCNDNEFNNSTKNKCPCAKPIWDRTIFKETMQTKFDIRCDNKWMISFSQIIEYVGMLLGALILGFCSDKYGRLPMFSLSCLILATFGSLVSAMPTAPAFMFMRCIEGIGAGGAVVTCYVLCIEYCGMRHRETITALFHIPINLSHLTLPGVSYLLRHCDEFQIALSIPVFLFVCSEWLLLESPKWLLDNRHIDEAVDVMNTFGKFNGRACENIREEIENYVSIDAGGSRKQVKFWQIFKHKKLSFNLGCMSVIYFLCGLGYYGVSQYIGQMSGDIHTNVALSGILLLPGTITSVFLLKLLPRRLFLMATTFLSGFFMIIVICIPVHLNLIRVAIAGICNCFFFMSFITVFLYSVELFPTSVRNSVLGFLSVISRIGQITAPPVNALPETISGVVYGVMAIIGTGLCYVLPETKNVELPSSLDESKKLSHHNRPLGENVVDRLHISTSETTNKPTE